MSHQPLNILLYLQPTQLTWFDTQTNQLTAIALSGECIRDMEVVNPELLATLIEQHITTAIATPLPAVLVIDSALVFTTTIPATAETAQAIESFLDLVPFDMVAQTQVVGGNETLVMATNQSLITTIRRVFHKHNILIESALPLPLYDTTNQQFTPLAAATAQYLIQLAPQLNSYSLIAPAITKPLVATEQPTQTTDTSSSTPTVRPAYAQDEPKKSSTLKVLIPLFALLVIVLVGMIIWQRQPPSRSTSTLAQASQSTARPATTNTATTSTTTQSAPVDISNVHVQVLAAQDDLVRAQEISKTFSQAGFKVLPDNQQTAISTSQTIVFVDSSYSPSLRTRIETLLKKHIQTYSLQEADSPVNGVTIIIGSSE